MRHIPYLASIALLLAATVLAHAQFGAVTGMPTAPAAQPGLFGLFGQNVTTPALSGAMSGFRPSVPSSAFSLPNNFPSMFSNLNDSLRLRPQPASKTIYQWGIFPTTSKK